MVDRRQFLGAALALPLFSRAGPQGGARSRSHAARLGASTACLAGRALLDAIRTLRGMGFGTIEMISYTGARHSVGDIPGFSFTGASAAERDAVFEATRPFAHVTAHLPFADLRPLSSNEAEREVALARIREALDGLAFLRGELGVMHVGWPDPGHSFRDVWRLATDTLRALGDYAGERGIRLGIETMQPDSVRDFTELIADTGHPSVGAVVDTGHIRGSSDIGLPPGRRNTDEARARFNDVLERLVLALGDKVMHVHLSDVTREDWTDHRTLGSGAIDFPRFFAALRKIGYGGLFVLELEEQDTAGALERSKAYALRHM